MSVETTVALGAMDVPEEIVIRDNGWVDLGRTGRR
jgi:hypothetical protein